MTSNVTLALVAGTLVGCGVYLVMARGVVRALLGVILLGNGINVLFLVASGTPGRAPIVGQGAADQSEMSDPLPQALVLTAIVISLAMTAFVMALSYRNSQLTSGDAIIDDIEDTRVRERAEDESDIDEDDIDTIEEPLPDSSTGDDDPGADERVGAQASADNAAYEERERAAGTSDEEVR